MNVLFTFTVIMRCYFYIIASWIALRMDWFSTLKVYPSSKIWCSWYFIFGRVKWKQNLVLFKKQSGKETRILTQILGCDHEGKLLEKGSLVI